MLPLQILHAKRELSSRINKVFMDAEIEDLILSSIPRNGKELSAFNMHKGSILAGLSELQRQLFAIDLTNAIFEFERSTTALNELRKQHCILPVDALLMLPLTDESFARVTAIRKARL